MTGVQTCALPILAETAGATVVKRFTHWQQAEKLSKEPPQEGSEERSEKELNLLRKKIVQKKYFAE